MAIQGRRLKDAVYAALAVVGRAVGSPVRVEFLDMLSQGGRTVEELARMSGQTAANSSQHLQSLLRARLVRRSKEGLFARYCIAAPEVGEFVRSLRVLAESQAVELGRARKRLLDELGKAEPVGRDELVRRVREGEAFVIDVRPSGEYRAGHLPGALSVPLDELDAKLDELPRGREIVAYCRGPYCVLAVEAVRRLREKGFHAIRLDMGVWDWRAEGLPVETEPVSAEKENI
ncbi:MAG: helix-turn-helix domain-containing protein [Planctomycetes bacterium]|nr:helix-turn-helix domain-containing protein [Planctomycetota bacterium]